MLKTPDLNSFLLSKPLSDAKIEKVAENYRSMLFCVLNSILERYERNCNYHFIDTKLNLINGENFKDDDPVKGKNVIYSWLSCRCDTGNS